MQKMEMMKAVKCVKYGSPEVLKISEMRKPVPEKNEVLIKIYAASVTNSDLFIRSSKVPFRMMVPMRLFLGIFRPRNPVLGEVLSGVIEEAGSEIKRFKAGDKVYGLTGFSLGAYADYKCMKETDSTRGCLAVMPGNISFEEATSAAYGGLLAFQALDEAGVKKGQKVLVYGASGTSGTIAVQAARHLGAVVTAVCGPSHLELVKALGADTALDYTNRESVGLLDAYDLVLDAVGKSRTSEVRTACEGSLKPGGKIVSIDDGPLLLESDRLDRVRALIEAHVIKPITDRCFAFEQIVEAHRYVEEGNKTGNVAITVNRLPLKAAERDSENHKFIS
jgi:NADPH:quinone reductase-like Zn-dependent oxidoreductase